jgi:branched-chain amino acid aminotransferase
MSGEKREWDAVPPEFLEGESWLDGELIPADQRALPLMTYTLHYGLGAFEGIRAYDGARGPAVFRLREHIERLFASAAMVQMEIPFTVDEVIAGCVATLEANGLPSAYLRPVAFVDDGKRGLAAGNNRVRVAIVTWPWGAYLGDEGLRRGIRTRVSSWRRMSAQSFLPKGKICGQYVNSILAKREALASGVDEGIMLDDAGDVAEASGENLFLIDGGVLITPPKSSPILEGITRDAVLRIASHLGIPVEERRVTRGQLYAADEIFLTGTAAEVTPVREVDGRTIGGGGRGPLTEKLQSTYFDVVNGRVDDFASWLTTYDVKSA